MPSFEEYVKNKRRKNNSSRNTGNKQSFEDFARARREERESKGKIPTGTTPSIDAPTREDARRVAESAVQAVLDNRPKLVGGTERTWFQDSIYADEWFDGGAQKAAFATGVKLTEKVAQGIIGMPEKMIDGVVMTIGQGINKAADAYYVGEYLKGRISGEDKETASDNAGEIRDLIRDYGVDTATDFVTKDLYDEEEIAHKYITEDFEFKTGKLAEWGLLDEAIDVDEGTITGAKTDDLAVSVGEMIPNIILGIVAPYAVPAVTATKVMGSTAEEELNSGESFDTAFAVGAVDAVAETLSEYLFSGIKFGGKTVDDLVVDPLIQGISNKVVKTAVRMGVDIFGEGAEEWLSEIVSQVGEAIIKDEDLVEAITSDEARDARRESFIGGMALGGGSSVGKTTSSTVQGKDPVTGLNKSEQAVVDKAVDEEVARREANGKKVSLRERGKIVQEMIENLDKGNFSIDAIEEVLGGDSYKAYKDVADREDAIRKEFEELGKKTNPTLAEQDRYAELKQQLEDIKKNSKKGELKDKVSREVYNLVKDTRIGESYNQRAKRGKAFEADLSQYSEKQRAVVQKAIDSGVLNDTAKTHMLVDWCARVYEDKGIEVDFVNNEKLRESGFVLEGKQVNGVVAEDGSIKLNVESNKMLESVVGHEVTHVFEGTEMYDALAEIAVNYAKTKGEYDTRLEALNKLYKGVYKGDDFNDKIQKELVADLVGDYLFTDSDFINKLCTDKPKLFRKILDEIEYLCKVATAGSKEARELEKLRKAFKDVWRESGKAQKNTTDKGDVKYNLQYETAEINNEIVSLVEKVKTNDYKDNDYVDLGVVSDKAAKKINEILGVDVSGYRISIEARQIRHILKDHGAQGLTDHSMAENKDIGKMEYAFSNFDSVVDGGRTEAYFEMKNGRNRTARTVLYEKEIGEKSYYVVQAVPETKRKTLFIVSAYIGEKGQKKEAPRLINANSPDATSTTVASATSKDNIPQNPKKSSETKQFSLSDNNIENVSTGYAYGESYYTMTYTQDGKVVGKLEYGEYDGQPNVKMIEVAPEYRRRGIGTKLLQELQKKYPGEEINFGMATPDGVKLLDAITYDVTDESIAADKQKLEELQTELNDLQAKLDVLFEIEDLTDAQDNELHTVGDRWQDVYESIHKLEKSLRGKSATKTFVKTDTKYSLSDSDNLSNETALKREQYNIIQKYNPAPEGSNYVWVRSPDDIKTFAEAINDDESFVWGDYSKEDAIRDLKRNKVTVYSSYPIGQGVFVSTSFNQARDYAGDGSKVYSKEVSPDSVAWINGDEGQYAQVETDTKYSLSDSQGRELSKDQQNYFKDSKVVDDNGSLKVVYHGTRNANFTVFKRNINYFTDSKEMADSYSPNGDVFEGYLNIENPYVIDAMGEKWSRIPVDENTKRLLEGYGGSVFKENGKWRTTPADIASVIEEAVDNGDMDYDGIIIKNVDDTGSYYKGTEKHIATDYIVFNSNKFKNINNTNPTDDLDINLSLSEEGEHPIRSLNGTYGEDVRLVKTEDMFPTKSELQNTSSVIPIAPMTEDIGMSEDDERAYFESLTDADAPPEFDMPIYEMPDTSRIDESTLKSIGQSLRETLSLNAKETKAIQEVVQKYSTTEFPSREKLFAEIKEKFGEKTWTEQIEEIAEIKMILKGFKFKVSDTIKSDIPDYNDWRKRNFGKITIAKDGMAVDDVYMGMSHSYPNFFPSDIINPTDQLLQFAEVMDLDANTVESYELDDYTIQDATDIIISEVNKHKEALLLQGLREEQSHFYKGIAEEETAGRSAVKTVEERLAEKIRNARAELLMNQQSRDDSFDDFEKKITRLQAEYNAKQNKNTKVANNLLRRIEQLQRTKRDVDADYSKRISDIEARIEKMESQEYQTAEHRKSKQEEYRSFMERLIGDTSTWKDKSMGIFYEINTLRRNLRDIVRGADGKRDIRKADAIYDELQGRYNHNEAELNRESNRIKGEFAKLKINKVESAYIQMLGEFRYNPHTTLTEDVVKDFYNKHKKRIDTAKVDKAIAMARQTYDGLLVRVNNVLREQGMKEIPYRKGYFPHFNEEKQGFLGKLFNWKTKNDEIPTDIAGLTEMFEPNRSWQSFNKQRKGDTTDYNFLKGLDTYVQGSLDWIYHIEDIQKRRAFENHIRYIHSEQGIKERIDAIRNSDEYDADEMQEQIDLVYKESKNPLGNFVTDFRTQTNTLAGKKSSMDRGMEQKTNRKIYSIMTNVSNRVTANSVVGSVSSALTNFIPITQSWVQVNPGWSLLGMKRTIQSIIRDDGTINKSDFLTNRLGKADNLYRTNWDKTSHVLGLLMDGIDNFTSQTIWRSKYMQNLHNGMSEAEAIKNADQFAENVMAGRSRGNNPTIFDSKNPITKVFTAFQLEVNNQYGYMFKDAPQDIAYTDAKAKAGAKLVAGYTTAFIGAYVYNALFSALTGRDAAFDPIGIVEDLMQDLGFGDDDEEEKEIETTDVVMNLIENVLEEVSFVGGLLGGGRIPISSAMPYGGIMEAIDGTIQDISDENTESLTKEWLRPLWYLVLPMGGGQAKKTKEGLDMFDDDLPISGSYTDSGDLRFPVEDTPGNKIQAALFGQWSSENAQDYFENERQPLKDEQIEEYVELDLPIAEYWEYREGLRECDTVEEKFDYVADLDLPVWKKNILINNIVDRDEGVDMENYDDFDSYEEFDFATSDPEMYEFLQENGVSYEEYEDFDDDERSAYRWAFKNPDKYTMSQAVTDDVAEYRRYTKDINDIKADYDRYGNVISGSRKEKVIAYINTLDIDEGQARILYKSIYKSDDTYDDYIVDYLNSRDDISREEMITILEELGATVDSRGNVWW